MRVFEHNHPLKLIDLHLQYPCLEEEKDDDDEGGELITKEGFHGVTCDRCGEEIHMYHRYYYKCMKDSSCHFSLHNFCAELSNPLVHALHPHPLFLQPDFFQHILINFFGRSCDICKNDHKGLGKCYYCSECSFSIHVKCALKVGKHIIHHPCHPHTLTCAISQPILCDCKACGKEHKGIFYQCTICVGFTIHIDCAFLPKTLLIQQRTNSAFYHTHQLTISYSFPKKDQLAKYMPRCRVCGHGFYHTENIWIYKCDKCMYYAHVDCTASRREAFMSIFLPTGKNKKNYEDADHPQLLHLPFPDETYSVPKHLFSKESGTSDDQVNLKHASHQHYLVLVDQTQCSGPTSSKINSLLLMCHDPMKKVQLLCNGCLRPIMSTMPFYKCVEHCDFVLHEWCTRLPTKIENHPGHSQHTLLLMYSNDLPFFFGVFECVFCRLPCNGFSYGCVECEYYVDVCCGFIPKEITHEAHPNHLLSLVQRRGSPTCHMCLRYPSGGQLSFHCKTCDIYIDPDCALLLPKTIRHKYDKHPLHLSYLPIENHKSEYFCEICENHMNPHQSFYHCQDCVQSVHTKCAPLILQCETNTHSHFYRNIYYFVSIKFGGTHNTDGHPHPLSFAQGINSDGGCSICHRELQYKMVFKCLECKFAIDYDCCKHLN